MAAKHNRFIEPAAASALVKYGPELSALKQLMVDTRQQYHQKVNSAQAGAAGIQAAVAAALPQLRGLYAGSVREGIPGLSGTQAINDMVSRGVRAQESAAGSRRTALTELAADRAKISSRRRDVAAEIGAFTSSEAGRLGRESSDRQLRNRISLRSTNQSERNSLRSAGIDPSTGQPIPGGKLDPNAKPKDPAKAAKKAFREKFGVDLASPDAHRSLVTKIHTETDRVGDLAKKAKADGRSRSEVDRVLRTGIKGGTIHDPTTGRVKIDPNSGLPVSSPDVKPVSARERGIILDLIYDGTLSARHAHELHKQGYMVSQLGLRGATPKERARARREKRVVSKTTAAAVKAIAG